MTELIKQLSRTLIEKAPQFAREHISRLLFKDEETQLTADMKSDNSIIRTSAKWYERDRKVTSSKHSTMEMNERIWFLLEASPDERDSWATLMATHDTNPSLVEIAKIFNYTRVEDLHNKTVFLTIPTDIREQLFKDFIIQLKSSDQQVKDDFSQKLKQQQKGLGYVTTDLSMPRGNQDIL